MEDKIRSLTVMQATHESQMKQMTMELDKERGKLESMQLRLQGVHQLFEDRISELCILNIWLTHLFYF